MEYSAGPDPVEIELPSGPWDLDLTADGALLACGLDPEGDGHQVRVLRTADGAPVAGWSRPGRHNAVGVAFLAGGTELVYLARPYEQITESLLVRVRLDDPGDGRELRRYPAFSRHHGIVRDAAAGVFAVLGDGAEVYDGVTGDLRFELPGRDLRAAFGADGTRLYVCGTEPGAIIAHDTTTGAETGRWPGPADGAGQVLVTPDDRFLLATGPNHYGVFLYDLAGGRRVTGTPDGAQDLGDDTRLGPWVTTPDGGTLAVLRGGLETYRLPEFRQYGDHPWIGTGRPVSAWQCAWARSAPVLAFGVMKDSRVLVLRLTTP